MAKPNKHLQWAQDHAPQAPGSVVGDNIEPAEAKRHDGWDKEHPPYQWFNWVLWLISQWIEYFDQDRNTVAQAAADFSAGDVVMVRSYDNGQARPGTLLDFNNTAKNVASLESDAQYLAIAQGSGADAEVKLVGRDDFTAVIQTYALSTQPAATITRVRCDGLHVVVAYDTKVDVFDRDAGTLLSTYDHGAAVNDICIDSTFCYLGGAANVDGDEVVRFQLADSVKSGSYAHGATINAVAVGGPQRLYIGGAAEATSGSAYTVRALDANTLAVRESRSGDPINAICVDRERVYLAAEAASSYIRIREVDTFRPYDVSPLFDGGFAGVPRSIAVDDRYLVIGTDAGDVDVRDKASMGRVWSNSTSDDAVVDIDGDQVFVGVASGVDVGFTVGRYNRPSYNRHWMRTDPSNRWSPPYKRLLIPVE